VDIIERARAAFGRWQRSETRVLFFLTVVVGCLSGLAAVGFHRSIDLIAGRLLTPLLSLPLGERFALTAVLLMLVGAFVGVALEYVVPFARGSGIPEVKSAYLLTPGPQLSLKTVVGKFILGALSIGAGFSLGREGPTVQICAGIGALVGRTTRRPTRVVKSLISVGAAAGIAAAFNTPLAAITFALEEVVGDLNQRLVGAIVVAAVAAAVIEHAILGGSPVFTVPGYTLVRWWELLAYAVLGLIAGLAATIFVRALITLRELVRRLRVPGWLKPALGGLLVAVIGVGAPEVFGIGYVPLSNALLGQLSFTRMAVLSGAKLLATVVSYCFGLSGGIFAPALFIGGMLGGAVGHVVELLLTASPQSVGSFALVGMGAFFAGAIRAPITSILIIFEMTGDYAIILPLMICNMISYTVAARLQRVPIYDALLLQDGIPIEDHHGRGHLKHLTVEQVMSEPAAPPPDLKPGTVTVFSDQTLDLAMLVLGRHGLTEIPVVTRTAPHHVAGRLSLQDIARGLKQLEIT
jgi:CIC family chloride channel protein